MVHRLAEAEVGGERERSDEVSQADAAVRRPRESFTGHLRDRPASCLWGEPRTTAVDPLRTVTTEEFRTGGRDVNHA